MKRIVQARSKIYEIKAQVRQQYMGETGIHGVGTDGQEVINIYYQKDDSPAQTANLDAIKALASEYTLKAHQRTAAHFSQQMGFHQVRNFTLQNLRRNGCAQ